MILKSIGRFLGPWLAFAALSGLTTGFVLGALITFLGVCMTVMTPSMYVTPQAVVEIIKTFPQYVIGVLNAIALGLISGFITGLIYALVGGKGDYWWSFLLFFGVALIMNPILAVPCAPLIVVGSLTAQYPETYLIKRPARYEWLKPLSHYLCDSWLVNPSKFARIVAILLPVTALGIFKVCF